MSYDPLVLTKKIKQKYSPTIYFEKSGKNHDNFRFFFKISKIAYTLSDCLKNPVKIDAFLPVILENPV